MGSIRLQLLVVVFFLAGCGGGGGSSITGTSEPITPTSLQYTTFNSSITLTWSAAPNATSYTIYWNTTGGVTSNDTQINLGTTNTYTHPSLINGSTYYYRVAASNSQLLARPSLWHIQLRNLKNKHG